jgi:hypothetical protein
VNCSNRSGRDPPPDGGWAKNPAAADKARVARHRRQEGRLGAIEYRCAGSGRQFIEGGQTSTHKPRPHSTSGIRFRDNKTGRRKSGRIWPGRLYQKLPFAKQALGTLIPPLVHLRATRRTGPAAPLSFVFILWGADGWHQTLAFRAVDFFLVNSPFCAPEKPHQKCSDTPHTPKAATTPYTSISSPFALSPVKGLFNETFGEGWYASVSSAKAAMPSSVSLN